VGEKKGKRCKIGKGEKVEGGWSENCKKVAEKRKRRHRKDREIDECC
jgi:hypothetical protein